MIPTLIKKVPQNVPGVGSCISMLNQNIERPQNRNTVLGDFNIPDVEQMITLLPGLSVGLGMVNAILVKRVEHLDYVWNYYLRRRRPL